MSRTRYVPGLLLALIAHTAAAEPAAAGSAVRSFVEHPTHCTQLTGSDDGSTDALSAEFAAAFVRVLDAGPSVAAAAASLHEACARRAAVRRP